MIKAYKKVGETPLEFLERTRKEKPELKNEKLSYAGRLDPMAEGEMIILVGEENNDREKYLNLDKEYEATFLIGFKTDTGDILGLIDHIVLEINLLPPTFYQGVSHFNHVVPEIHLRSNNVVPEIPLEDCPGSRSLKDQINHLKQIKKQTYPWFSGKAINGKKLFDHFKEGNLNIERPKIDVEIKELIFKNLDLRSKEEIQEYIFDSINKVNGDFRQEEILNKWRESFAFAPSNFQTFTIKIKVSSGTFIRALCEEFDFPCCLLNLKRTKIFI